MKTIYQFIIDRFDNFASQYEELQPDLPIRKDCNNCSQYHRRETTEVNPTSRDIGTMEDHLSLNLHEVAPDDLH